MADTIVLRCVTCRDQNKHCRDRPGYEAKQTDYTSLTEAYRHMLDSLQAHGFLHEIELTNLGEQ